MGSYREDHRLTESRAVSYLQKPYNFPVLPFFVTYL